MSATKLPTPRRFPICGPAPEALSITQYYWNRAIVAGRGRTGAKLRIVLFTEFGLHGSYTGQMKAVLQQMAVPAIDLFADASASRTMDGRSAHAGVGNPKASAYLLAADEDVLREEDLRARAAQVTPEFAAETFADLLTIIEKLDA